MVALHSLTPSFTPQGSSGGPFSPLFRFPPLGWEAASHPPSHPPSHPWGVKEGGSEYRVAIFLPSPLPTLGWGGKWGGKGGKGENEYRVAVLPSPLPTRRVGFTAGRGEGSGEGSGA